MRKRSKINNKNLQFKEFDDSYLAHNTRRDNNQQRILQLWIGVLFYFEKLLLPRDASRLRAIWFRYCTIRDIGRCSCIFCAPAGVFWSKRMTSRWAILAARGRYSNFRGGNQLRKTPFFLPRTWFDWILGEIQSQKHDWFACDSEHKRPHRFERCGDIPWFQAKIHGRLPFDLWQTLERERWCRSVSFFLSFVNFWCLWSVFHFFKYKARFTWVGFNLLLFCCSIWSKDN